MGLFEWLSTSLNRYRKPQPPRFQFELSAPKGAWAWFPDNTMWRCLLCNHLVTDTAMALHATFEHGWQAPNVKITAARTR